MYDFKFQYIKKKARNNEQNIHRQIEPNVYIYMQRYDSNNDWGKKFTIERLENDKLVYKLTSDYIRWNRSKETWTINNYVIREINGNEEKITKGSKLDTLIAMRPNEFKTQDADIETMDYFELLSYIDQLKLRGVNSIEQYEVERHRRAATPFSVFILTIMGVAIASRKIRGGIGLHLGFGILGAFTYIMFQQITKTFALSGTMGPMLSMWLPNIVYLVVALFLYRRAAR